MNTKRCNRHKEYFPEETDQIPATSEFFYKNKSNKTDGLYPYCKRCAIIKSGKWNKENPESTKKSILKNHKTQSWKKYKKEL